MSNEVTIPPLPNNASPPLTSLIELSNADVSQHTSLGNVLRQFTGDPLISINGVILISNNAVINVKVAVNVVIRRTMLENNVILDNLSTGITSKLNTIDPSH